MAETYKEGPYQKTDTKVSFHSAVYWEKTNESVTTVTYTFRCGIKINSGQSPEFNGWAGLYTSVGNYTGTGGTKGYSGKYRELVGKKTITFTKGTSSRTETVGFRARKNSNSSSYQSNGTLTFTIPALQPPTLSISDDSISRDVLNFDKINFDFSATTVSGRPATVNISVGENSSVQKILGGTTESIDTSLSNLPATALTAKVTITDDGASSLQNSFTKTIPSLPAPTIISSTTAKRDSSNEQNIIVNYAINSFIGDSGTVKITCSASSIPKEYNYSDLSGKTGNNIVFENCGVNAANITIEVTSNNNVGSNSKTYNIQPAFYTMDFGAKGKSIAMGKMAEDVIPYIIDIDKFKQLILEVNENIFSLESFVIKITKATPSSLGAIITFYEISKIGYLYEGQKILTEPGAVGDRESELINIGISPEIPNDEYIKYFLPFPESLPTIPENGLFECNMDAWFHNKILGVYPVGSIYMSMNPTNPSEFFGGTWERIGTGRTLVAAGDGDDAIIDENNFTGRGTHTTASTSFPAGELGGELWHKLTAAESGVPAHYHHLNTNGYWALGADSKYSLTNDANGGVSGSGYQVPQIHVSDNAWGRLFDSANNTAANASSSHNIMSSYLAVYMWKRTA